MNTFQPYDGEIRVCFLGFVSKEKKVFRLIDIETRDYFDNISMDADRNVARLNRIADLKTKKFFVRFTVSNRQSELLIIDANEFVEYRGFNLD